MKIKKIIQPFKPFTFSSFSFAFLLCFFQSVLLLLFFASDDETSASLLASLTSLIKESPSLFKAFPFSLLLISSE